MTAAAEEAIVQQQQLRSGAGDDAISCLDLGSYLVSCQHIGGALYVVTEDLAGRT